VVTPPTIHVFGELTIIWVKLGEFQDSSPR